MPGSIYQGITLDGEAVEIRVNGEEIEAVRAIPPVPGLPRLLPVLVDLQQNGALGHAYNNLNGDGRSELRIIAEHLLRNGVGRVLATFTTAEYSRLKTAAATLRKVLDGDPVLNSLFAGIFHEGVFISRDRGWRGGHVPDFILEPDWEKFRQLNRLSGGRVRMVNIAPEEPGALDFIGKAAASGVRVSLGHCKPDSETIHEASRRGASMVTHFGNGAAPEIHRFANPFWGFLDDPALSLGLIGDGFHLPPEIVRTALRCKGPEHCFMVSDANIYSGCKPGLYHRIGGLDCVIEDNGFIHVHGQEILAGAWFQQNRSVEFLVETCRIPFDTAWRLCSVTPAALAGLSLPMLRAGEEASFVIYSYNKIQRTVFKGVPHEP